jgi:hypothetical protein
MREEQIEAIKDYVKAQCAMMIGDALGRDTLHESLRVHEEEARLTKVLGDFDDDDE